MRPYPSSLEIPLLTAILNFRIRLVQPTNIYLFRMATNKSIRALLTGTSSEFIGQRPLPLALRVVNQTIFVIGPKDSGLTVVAQRIAGPKSVARIGARALNSLIDAFIESGSKEWPDRALKPNTLIIDGPQHLLTRKTATKAMLDLLSRRRKAGTLTIVVQQNDDDSLTSLIRPLKQGEYTIVGLRFPKGIRGRRRFARRYCKQSGYSVAASRGLAKMDDWTYSKVIATIENWTE